MPFFGHSVGEKWSQIALSDARKLVEGSIESSWIGEQISRSPEVIRRMRHTSGGDQSRGSSSRLAEVVMFTENDLKL